MDSNLAESLQYAREIAADTPDMAARMAITALVVYVENTNRIFHGGISIADAAKAKRREELTKEIGGSRFDELPPMIQKLVVRLAEAESTNERKS